MVGVIFGVLAAIAGLTDFIGSRLVRARTPVGVAIDKTGAPLVADDSGNTLWRVKAAHPRLTQR